MLKYYRFFTKSQPLLLLSHMRSYSSLLGHILGSNPHIDGYYEMHRHYFSTKSLYASKMQYLMKHRPANESCFFFDKLLHNHLIISSDFAKLAGLKLIIMVREPQSAVNSIIKMAMERSFSSELERGEMAERYYLERLSALIEYSHRFKGEYFYIDSEELVDNTNETLDRLSGFLNLSKNLQPKFQKFHHTSQSKFGDTSGNLDAGQVINVKQSTTLHEINSATSQDYCNAILTLRNNSINRT